MKKQIISALCAAIAFCLSFASCGAANQVEKRTTAQTTSEAVTTTAAPRSVLADRDPAADYAIDPPLELYDNNEIAVFPDYFHRFEYVGEEAVEVIAMLNIVNALTAEQENNIESVGFTGHTKKRQKHRIPKPQIKPTAMVLT